MSERINAASLSIRAAQAFDLPAIEQCARSAYQLYVERIGREPAPMIANFVAAIAAGHVCVGLTLDSDGTAMLAGYVVFYQRGDAMHLENVAVLPTLARRGFGRTLVAYVEQQAREQRCTGVELYTNAKMTENLSLYPSLGYRETDRRTEDGFDRVYFFKSVS